MTLPENFWKEFESILEKRLLPIHDKLDRANIAINLNYAKGCAQRPNDIRRVESLEKWREGTTNRFIGLLLSVIFSLSAAIYSLFK